MACFFLSSTWSHKNKAYLPSKWMPHIYLSLHRGWSSVLFASVFLLFCFFCSSFFLSSHCVDYLTVCRCVVVQPRLTVKILLNRRQETLLHIGSERTENWRCHSTVYLSCIWRPIRRSRSYTYRMLWNHCLISLPFRLFLLRCRWVCLHLLSFWLLHWKGRAAASQVATSTKKA